MAVLIEEVSWFRTKLVRIVLAVRNPWVQALLKWHGHDVGGVRVPFQEDQGNPLKGPIETSLLAKLRKTAQQIAVGEDAPRLIFLVGGPGNGKSEAVQVFLEELGQELDCKQQLLSELTRKFQPCPISPPLVELSPDDEYPELNRFFSRVGKLTVIQDASASGQRSGDASVELVEALKAILSHDALQVALCCINRGLLYRAIEAAGQDDGANSVRVLLEEVASRTGLGLDALSASSRKPCWPLDGMSGVEIAVGAWPLDLESLLEENGSSKSPIEEIIVRASASDKWMAGCSQCPAQDNCPFYQNASLLRQFEKRQALLKILRHGELATGQRWNFRDAFSLVAELMVGEQQDFQNEHGHAVHPCDWVNERSEQIVEAAENEDTGAWAKQVQSALELSTRIYPQALFPTGIHTDDMKEQSFLNNDSNGKIKTLALWEAAERVESGTHGFARDYLRNMLAPLLKPELRTSAGNDDSFRNLEDAFSQAIKIGIDADWRKEIELSRVEEVFLDMVMQAEAEWDPLSRESAQADQACRYLRRIASDFAKRALGTRTGKHSNDNALEEYHASLRSQKALGDIGNLLENLLGGRRFEVDALGGIGQMDLSPSARIRLVSRDVPRVTIHPAPKSDDGVPPHDMPCIVIDQAQPIPLTFELFEALQLHRRGCRTGSLPPVLATSLGRLRQLHAAHLCRDKESFMRRRAHYELVGIGSVVLSEEGEAVPVLERKDR
ncbi:hypothetical protein [Seohaeicola saemankumensis]|uniref:hypothetical protein n=1 Tax=Seohaeicola saemankumensis TaxID=481181 RepID=UPI0036D3AF54